MTEPNPTGETPAAAQVAAPEPPQQPAAELWEDGKPFDPARAKATIQALRGEAKLSKQEKDELEQLRQEKKAKAEAEMTEAERLKKRAEEAEAQAAKLQSDILRRDVAAETGLPAVFADRLKGSTKEELLADAQEILKALPAQQKVNPKLNATNPANADAAETDAQKRERLFGRQGNPFGDETLKAKGGGVFWPK